MNKRKGCAILLIFTGTLITAIVVSLYLPNKQRQHYNPAYIWNYTHTGKFVINPDLILESIHRGEAYIFIPLSVDPDQVEDLNNTITWTQSDFLKVIDALSQYVWNESLDLETWQVYFIYFQTGCMDDLRGFRELDIVYYKYLGKTDWERIYSSRIVEISLWNGVVRWGDTTFSDSYLSSWDRVDLAQFSVTADEALKIAEENGGKDTRLGHGNICDVSISAPYSDFNHSWNISYGSGVDFNVTVNPYTGRLKIIPH